MTGAFFGDPALKTALLDRLNAHAANGSLMFGATAWDGQGGTPLGVSTEGGDSADYAARYGYPLALAGVLDPMTAHARPDEAIGAAMSWVTCVDVGADLSPVPERIADHILQAMAADRLAAPFYAEVCDMYRAEAVGTALPRRVWTDLRERIEQCVEAEPPGSDARAALTACATACWPLRTSSSVLPTLIAVWLKDANRHPDPEFGDAERVRARTVLDEIYQETQPQRDAGDPVDIPAMFRARTPTLAAAFEAQLARANARYRSRSREVPGLILGHLAAISA